MELYHTYEHHKQIRLTIFSPAKYQTNPDHFGCVLLLWNKLSQFKEVNKIASGIRQLPLSFHRPEILWHETEHHFKGLGLDQDPVTFRWKMI